MAAQTRATSTAEQTENTCFVHVLIMKGSSLANPYKRQFPKVEVIALPSKPSPNDVESFKHHVRSTGCPETFPSITTARATNLDGAEILAEFPIDRKKRPNLDEAPCPICSPNSPKFLSGYLVWFPGEKCIRAIGKECGARINNKWDRAKKAFKERQKQENRERFLEENLWKVPSLIEELQKEHHRSLTHKGIWSNFRKKCPTVTQALRNGMAKGYLTVSRARSSTSGTSTVSSSGHSQFVEIRIGSVVGHTAVKGRFEHHRSSVEPLETLAAINHGDDCEKVFLAICDMNLREHQAVERIIKFGQ